jgi:uncharacterized protein YmfQ (DUF2313 family)
MMSITLSQGQPVCGLTGDDYADVLTDLLPLGYAWPREPFAVITRTMRGLAEEFARITERDCDLLAESYPCGAVETLPDWERITGLPDPCTGALPTMELRQMAVCARLRAGGDPSIAYFIGLAEVLGYTITIEEFTPFAVSRNRVGERLSGEEWRFVWCVTVSGPPIGYFRASENRVGDRLRFNDPTLLMCVLNAYKPAHTIIIFKISD